MMVALFAVCVRLEERSSRGIERRCREDVAFRVITANRVPDHATIARVRARHEQALAAAFTQVLALCAKAGLVLVGVVALDGSLLAGNFSPGGDGQLRVEPLGGRADARRGRGRGRRRGSGIRRRTR
jgi:hypothetical protein